MSDKAASEISRFGITRDEWEAFRDRYSVLSSTMPDNTAPDGLCFRDWEAQQLRKVFEHFMTDNPDVCAVIAHMMWYVSDRNHHTREAR